MPMLYACLSVINSRFRPGCIADFASQADAFAPGKPLNARALMGDEGASLTDTLEAFLKSLPETTQDVLRSVLYNALKGSSPRQVTVAWAPAYDHEVTVHDATCGVTVMLRSRYPAEDGVGSASSGRRRRTRVPDGG